MNRNILQTNFREKLLREDVVSLNLNEVSEVYRNLLLADIKSGKILIEEVSACHCGSKKLEPLAKIDRFGLAFGSLICEECGLVITSPRIKQESLPYYYESIYHPLNYGKESLDNQSVLYCAGQGKKIFEIIKPYLSEKRELSVLEIGSGTGSVLQEFRDEGKKESKTISALGTDYNEGCIKLSNDKRVDAILGDIDVVTKLGKKFDVIIFFEVLGNENIADDSELLQKFGRMLNDNGAIFISIPSYGDRPPKEYFARLYDQDAFVRLMMDVDCSLKIDLYGQLHPINRKESDCRIIDRYLYYKADFMLAVIGGKSE